MFSYTKKIFNKHKNNHNFYFFIIAVVFFITLTVFQIWLETLSDYPNNDEYYVLLTALGMEFYTRTLYVKMLSFFTFFAHDFYSLHTFNFVMAHMVLCLSFFLYHMKRKISFGTNIFFTAILGISSLNVELNRKMHFWAAAFFFLIMALATYLEGRSRKIFLLISFFIMGFFRAEFFFSAVLALLLLFPNRKKKDLVILSVLLVAGFALAALGVSFYFIGAGQLVKDTINQMNPGVEYFWLKYFFKEIQLIANNIQIYFSNSYLSFSSNLNIYFINMMNAFVLLFFMSESVKKNIKHFYKTYKEDFIFYYFPACFAMLTIRYYYLYTIAFYALFLSVLAFLLNSKEKPIFSYIITFLVMSTLIIAKPKFPYELNKSFWTKLQALGQINRNFHDMIKLLPQSSEKNPYKILSYEYLEPIFPKKGHQFFLIRDLTKLCSKGITDFDMIILDSEWESDEIKKCILPNLKWHHEIQTSLYGKIYLSDRVKVKITPSLGRGRW